MRPLDALLKPYEGLFLYILPGIKEKPILPFRINFILLQSPKENEDKELFRMCDVQTTIGKIQVYTEL